MKKGFIFFTIILVLCLVICRQIQNQDSIDSVRFIVNLDDGTKESILLYEKDDIYYAFLPSYAQLAETTIMSSLGYTISVEDKIYEIDDTCSELCTNTAYKISLFDLWGIQITEKELIIMKSANIPTLSIQLSDGSLEDVNSDKEVAKKGVARTIQSDGTIDYYGDFYELHGRGNSSWWQEKKPYALEFSENVNLLEMGESSDWVLVANAMDESNLRNKIVYDVAKMLGLEYSVESRYIDLYVDNQYLGLYLLTNKIQVSENSVDILDLNMQTQSVNQKRLSQYEKFEKFENGIHSKGYQIPSNPDDITGGYLIEFELSSRTQDENSLFTTLSGQAITVKYPKYASEEQMDYISSYVQEFEDSLNTDKVLEYIDIECWSKYYLVQELFANVSRTSFFFYKDTDMNDEKLYPGPLWDFDLSMGTAYESDNTDPKQICCNWGWFEKLNNSKYFDTTKQYYISELKPLVQLVINEKIDEYESVICQSYLMNAQRWDGIQYNKWVNHYETQKEHSDYIKEFLSERIKFLDELWIEGKVSEYMSVNQEVTNTDSGKNLANSRNPVSAEEVLSPVQRIKDILYNEKTYLNVGVVLISLFIFTFVISDVKRQNRLRRNTNDN